MQQNPGYVPRSVGIPIVFSFFFNIAYGFYLQKVFKVEFSCGHLIPKLEKYSAIFPREGICEANSFLWTAFYAFILNIVVLIIVTVLINRKILLSPGRITLKKSTLPAGAFFLFALILVLAGYVYADLRFFPRSSGRASPSSWEAYVWYQVLILHVGAGLINFVFNMVSVPCLFMRMGQISGGKKDGR
jgi:uncharacterized membrane protein